MSERARDQERDVTHPGPEPYWWWFSFCDVNRPAGQQFLGAVIVSGATLHLAIRRAWQLGINPGGEVAFYPLTVMAPSAEWRNRLLTREKADQAGNALIPCTDPDVVPLTGRES